MVWSMHECDEGWVGEHMREMNGGMCGEWKGE